jgi:hypothetical protein
MSGTRASERLRRNSRRFSIDEANRTLPLVRMIVRDLAELSQDVTQRRQCVLHLTDGRQLESGDPYGEELVVVRDQLQMDMVRIAEYVGELESLGLRVRDAVEGLVEFPSHIEGRSMNLSWRLGEPEVMYWTPVPDELEPGEEPVRRLLVAPLTPSQG